MVLASENLEFCTDHQRSQKFFMGGWEISKFFVWKTSKVEEDCQVFFSKTLANRRIFYWKGDKPPNSLLATHLALMLQIQSDSQKSSNTFTKKKQTTLKSFMLLIHHRLYPLLTFLIKHQHWRHQKILFIMFHT